MSQAAEPADTDDNEALMPHSHAVLGLKVADAEEALTVRRVGMAVFGLMLLLALHFIVHVASDGHVEHAVAHLLTASVLPVAGYIAVSQRSTKAAWAFHLMTVIWLVFHLVMLIVVLLHVLQLQTEGAANACARFAQLCQGKAAETSPLSFSEDRRFWRCGHGLCIDASRHCDGEANCFDRSDEVGCLDAAALAGGERVPTAPPSEEGKEMRECRMLLLAQARAPRLKWWWILSSLPMAVLCLFASYHSLEFYVQLRVRRLSARVDRAAADATVFDRADAEQQLDRGTEGSGM